MEELPTQKTILIVDDEDGVRESVREVLSDEGYRVVDTADGARVLEIIKEERPELVLLDIWMPQVDGIGLLKEIKRHEPEINRDQVWRLRLHRKTGVLGWSVIDRATSPRGIAGRGRAKEGRRRNEEIADAEIGVQRCLCRSDAQAEDLEKERRVIRARASFWCQNRADFASTGAA